MRKKLNWQAYSNQNRIEIIEAIKDTISTYDGVILNFNMFSDLALSLCIEIEENQIAKLHKKLSELLSISDLRAINQKSKTEWLIFLNISFSQGKGKLKMEIPNVPG